jgi:hypothetical protein
MTGKKIKYKAGEKKKKKEFYKVSKKKKSIERPFITSQMLNLYFL